MYYNLLITVIENILGMLFEKEPYKTCFTCYDQLMGLGDILGSQSQTVGQIKIDIHEMEVKEPGSSLAVLRNKNVIQVMLEIKSKLMICVMSQTFEPETVIKVNKAISTIGDMINVLQKSI